MRALIIDCLKGKVDSTIVEGVILSYEKTVGEFRKGDAEATLNASGKFVEHVLRAIHFIRSGVVILEIKSVAAAVKDIESDGNLPESLRVLVPRIASSMLFDIRSKRGAAHVKEVSPRYIDASLAAHAASWILAEFVRLYYTASETTVAEAMAMLMFGNMPLIERFEDELAVTTPLTAETEILLLISAREPNGIDRKLLGTSVKRPASTVTRTIQKLIQLRHIHKLKSGAFRITGPGEQVLVTRLAALRVAV